MIKYTAIIKHDESKQISVCFYIEQDRILSIGDKMNKINDQAYMNGYNWEAFINFYLKQNEPDLLKGMGSDPEAGMYVAYYELTPENLIKSEKLVAVFQNLIDNEEKIYEIVEEHGAEIEWD